MKGNKLFGAGFLLIVALLLVAIPASASAKTLLQFNEESGPATSGAAADTVITVGQECTAEAKGTVVANPASKVVVKAPTAGSEECTKAGVSESGHIEETTWETSGTLKVKGKIEITYSGPSGPCVFAFTKFTVPKLTYPSDTFVQGESTGKLNKKASNKTKNACEKKLTKKFILDVQDGEEEPFEDELT